MATDFFSFHSIFTPGHGGTYENFFKGAMAIALTKRKKIIFDPISEDEVFSYPLNKVKVDGRLLVGLVNSRILKIFKNDKVPLVVIGDHQCAGSLSSVNVDCFAAGQMAAKYLWELGHRRICLFCEPIVSNYQDEFRCGLEEILKKNGGLENGYSLVDHDITSDEMLNRLRNNRSRPTAVVAVQVGCMSHILGVARALGLLVPGDLSAMFFGRPDVHLPYRGITHIDPAYEEVGLHAMEMLIRLVEKKTLTSAERILVSPILIEGTTCGVIARRR